MRVAVLSLVASIVVAMAGRSSRSEASCAYLLVLEDRTQQFVDASGVQTGPVVGTGVAPGCNDGQPVPAATLGDPLVEVVGLDPSQAVARDHGEGRVDLLVRADLTGAPPREVAAYLADHLPPSAAQ